jgi:hypothetical protein
MSHIPFPCLLSSRIGKQASYTMAIDTACIQHASTNQRTGGIHQNLPKTPRWKRQMSIQSGLIDTVTK